VIPGRRQHCQANANVGEQVEVGPVAWPDIQKSLEQSHVIEGERIDDAPMGPAQQQEVDQLAMLPDRGVR
jgi:hypothetical protein